jgi:hypothetical protein
MVYRAWTAVSICTSCAGILLFGCTPGNQSIEECHFQSASVPDTIALNCVFEIPDSVHFHEVYGICTDDIGNTYILDGIGCCIYKFDQDNDYLYAISGKGSGPGEISSPTGFSVLNNNRIAVVDNGMMKYEAFSTDGEYLGDAMKWSMFVPNDICAVAESSFAGSVFSFSSTGDGMIITCDIYRYGNSPEPEFSYYVREWNWSPENSHEMYEEYGRILYTGDVSGVFYIVPDSREYRIQVHDIDGSLMRVLTRTDLSRVAKQDSVIDMERELFEHLASQDQAYTGGYQPDPFYPVIRSIGVDSLGRLWVCRGDMYPEVLFDVWESNGESVKSVYVSTETMSVIDQYVVDGGSIIGYHQSVEGEVSVYSAGLEY